MTEVIPFFPTSRTTYPEDPEEICKDKLQQQTEPREAHAATEQAHAARVRPGGKYASSATITCVKLITRTPAVS